MFNPKPYAIAASVLVLATLGACTDATSPSGRSVTLSFSTAPGAAFDLSSPLLAVNAAGPIVITKAQLVFSEVELEPVGASCATMAEPGDDSCPEIQLGPTIVDLPLDASAKSVLTVAIPAGSYEELEFEIDAVSSHSDDDALVAQAFLAANPQFEGVSIRVEGTFNGEPFVFTTGVEVEMELEFQPPVTIDGATGLVIHVNLANWFRAEDGSSIDPRTANQGGENKSRVDENIEKSFDAYEDSIED